MDKVIIRDLLARGIIGDNDWERVQPQDILINVLAFTDMKRAAETDDVADCVNYKTLGQRLRLHAETAARFTVEALANDLARICLEDKNIVKVVVRVEKPGAVRFAASVGVEVERSRNESAA